MWKTRKASTIHYREITVGPPTFDGNKRTAQTETVTVTRGSLKVVKVYIYTETPEMSFIAVAEIGTKDTNVVRAFVASVAITFQDPANPDNSEITLNSTALMDRIPCEHHRSIHGLYGYCS